MSNSISKPTQSQAQLHPQASLMRDNDKSKATPPPSNKGKQQYEVPNFLILKKFDSPFVNKVLNRNIASGEVQIKGTEFSNLHPKDDSPNPALLHINYMPRNSCVDPVSLSLYLETFLRYACSHESCITIIINDLINLLDPFQITVTTEAVHLGGVHFRPTCRYVRK